MTCKEANKHLDQFFYRNRDILRDDFFAEGMNYTSVPAMIDSAYNKVNSGINCYENDFHDTIKPYIVIEYAMYLHKKNGSLEEFVMDFDLFKTLSQLREYEDQIGALQDIQIVNGRIGKSEDIPV